MAEVGSGATMLIGAPDGALNLRLLLSRLRHYARKDCGLA
jgi:hypothetical protein